MPRKVAKDAKERSREGRKTVKEVGKEGRKEVKDGRKESHELMEAKAVIEGRKNES